MSTVRILVMAWLFFLTGCGILPRRETNRARAPESSKPETEPIVETTAVHAGTLPQGYALLAKLMGDEGNVSKLLIIKRERRPLHDLVQEISRSCKAAHAHLESVHGKRNLEQDGLPAIETISRKIISKQRARQLLTEGGKEFEVAILVSQNEALTYGSALARALATLETEPTHRAWLLNLSQRLAELQEQVYRMLFENYAWHGR